MVDVRERGGIPIIIAQEYIATGDGGLVNGLPLPLSLERYEEMRETADMFNHHICSEINGIQVCCVPGTEAVPPGDILPEGRDLTPGEWTELHNLGNGIDSVIDNVTFPEAENNDIEETFDWVKSRDKNRAQNLLLYDNVNMRRRTQSKSERNGKRRR
jgi:hypothetical protein